jgi:hypothetical protein
MARRSRTRRDDAVTHSGGDGVSGTLPGVDVRGFYLALGIELAGWARREAPAGCFADPDAHALGDRDPSCSVNVETGAWHCWGCGAAGGAYDAALACGRDPRGAIELMIAHGLTARRTGARPRRSASPRIGREAGATERLPGAGAGVELDADEQELLSDTLDGHERSAKRHAAW